jgi:hypothetical protein
MLIKRNQLLAFIFILFCFTSIKKAGAQTATKDYTKYPYWKDMINDPATNFFEAKKAFDLFWKGKEMPIEEEDVMGEKEEKLKNNLANRLFRAKELKEQQAQQALEALAFDVKRYRHWLIETEPYIHDDGSIMSTEERLEIWKRHYGELKAQH